MDNMYTDVNILPENPAFIHNEPLSAHTTFRIGGPAAFYLRPPKDSFIKQASAVLRKAKDESLPLFILGGGSNILAADEGFYGITLDTTAFSGCSLNSDGDTIVLSAQAGTQSDTCAEFAKGEGLSGLEFLAGLPGTIGGAVWMNARCYEKSISDILVSVTIIDESFAVKTIPYKTEDYGYKKSPFQDRPVLILEARLNVKPGSKTEIKKAMETFRCDRKQKGHYKYPSAGSIFKNNHKFGKPSGKIIEELGLRGRQIGGARIADWHGNFIINTGGATAADIRALITLAQNAAREKFGIELEREVIFL